MGSAFRNGASQKRQPPGTCAHAHTQEYEHTQFLYSIESLLCILLLRAEATPIFNVPVNVTAARTLHHTQGPL